MQRGKGANSSKKEGHGSWTQSQGCQRMAPSLQGLSRACPARVEGLWGGRAHPLGPQPMSLQGEGPVDVLSKPQGCREPNVAERNQLKVCSPAKQPHGESSRRHAEWRQRVGEQQSRDRG